MRFKLSIEDFKVLRDVTFTVNQSMLDEIETGTITKAPIAAAWSDSGVWITLPDRPGITQMESETNVATMPPADLAGDSTSVVKVEEETQDEG